MGFFKTYHGDTENTERERSFLRAPLGFRCVLRTSAVNGFYLLATFAATRMGSQTGAKGGA